MADRGSDVSTLRAGLIGAHISRTRLPAALEIMCAEAGWILEFELIDTGAMAGFDFVATLDRARGDGWTGMTVTHPWKTDARAYAGDGMAAEVAHLGASNTLVFGDGVTGYNTDYTGFAAVIEPLGSLGDVIVMGAGGVAEAVVPALCAQLQPKARVGIFDLDADKAAALAQRCGAQVEMIDRDARADWVARAHGLVNCTPLGMAEYPGSAFDGFEVTNSPPKWAFDAVYTPVDTPFLRAASDAGLTVLTGFDLFKAMALRSFQAYTNLSLDPAVILPRLDALRPE